MHLSVCPRAHERGALTCRLWCNTDRLVSAGKDVSGAGATFISPGWLTALQRNWGDAASAVRGCGVERFCVLKQRKAIGSG